MEWKGRIFTSGNPGLEKELGHVSLSSVQRRIQTWLDKQAGFPSADKSGLVSLDESGLRTAREVVALAKEMRLSPAQVALAWLRHRSVPVIPIIGARKLTQLEDNLKSLAIVLSPEQVHRLDDVSAVPMGFPHGLLTGVVQGSLFGGMRDQIIA